MKKTMSLLFLVTCLIALLTGCKTTGQVEHFVYSVSIDGVDVPGEFTGALVKDIPNGDGEFHAQLENGATLTIAGPWENGHYTTPVLVSDYAFSIEYEGKTLLGSYDGSIVDWKPDGDGTFSYSEDDEFFTYSGAWSSGVFSGNGHISSNFFTVHFSDVDRVGIVDGDTIDGFISGFGTFTATNSEGNTYTYTGEWENSLFNGQGTRVVEGLITEIGTFSQGNFTPTVYEYYQSMGTYNGASYTITNNATEFLIKYPGVFSDHNIPSSVSYEKNFNYSDFSKNPSPYGSKLVVIKATIINIFEGEDYGVDHAMFVAYDSNRHYYYGYMYGLAPGIYDGTNVTFTALPLSYFSYENIVGGKTNAMACAVVNIKKR